jgi:hypothetical protein
VVEPGKAVTVTPDDPRYADLAGRGSRRFAGKPDYVRLVCSTEQVVDAVQDAVRRRLRVAVRSGGHCLENFVSDPAVRVVIDTSLMTAVSYDSRMDAFAIEPGVRLGEAYRRLFLGGGVTIPAGVSPNVGVGGHVLGGGFGYLCRQHGLAADHLYGVEVVVVDETGTARSVTATREPSDPHRDLWWAHTGGGGAGHDVGSPVLPRPVRRHRWRPRSRRRHRRSVHQPSGHRPGRSGVEHIGLCLAHDVLPRQLFPPPRRQAALGSPRCVPPRPVHPPHPIDYSRRDLPLAPAATVSSAAVPAPRPGEGPPARVTTA